MNTKAKKPSARAMSAALAAAGEREAGKAPAQVSVKEGIEDQGAAREDDAEEVQAETTTLVQHVVTVTNDPATKVPTEVYEHEVPVLEAIHGIGNVEIVDGKSEEVEVVEFTPEAEFDRMLRKYGTKNEGKVRSVYGGPNALAQELGMRATVRTGTQTQRQQPQSIAVDRRVRKPVSSKAKGTTSTKR